MTFDIDKEAWSPWKKKGDVLNFCMTAVRVNISKGGLIIDEEKGKEESIIIIEDMME